MNFQIVLVTGATGSGKTTQVPQFILEDAFVKQRPVRIIVCQPRRLAVTTVSERVAQVGPVYLLYVPMLETYLIF